ncbi:MAG: T9SS type A sorting domain-containing protein [Bacteroidetes bacterium]|nr:T9SS type A sorting domain-containing protein [Bacteroidota bacterium]
MHLFRCIYVVLMILCASSGYAQAPTVQDCLVAIPVCNPVYTTIQSYVGHGNVYPEIHDNSQCPLCMDGEKNDVFYVITVQTNGLLPFVLTPNNPQNDYDWSVFNMTNAECSQLYPEATSLQVSCNSWGVIGNNGPTGVSNLMGGSTNCNGPGQVGSKFNKDITVSAGETYLINISNWSSTNQSGYTLDFSSSTATILDNVPPQIDSIQEEILCAGASSLYIKFSENVLCADVNHHPEKFTLTGPAGTYTITDVTGAACATGGTQGKTFQLMISPPAFEGNYQLNIIGIIRDLCLNAACYQGYPFSLTETNSPQVSAGNDVSITYGAFTQPDGSATGDSCNYSFSWTPTPSGFISSQPNPVAVPVVNTTYHVSVNDGFNQVTGDVSVTANPLPQIHLGASDTTLCIYDTLLLDAGNPGASFLWSNGSVSQQIRVGTSGLGFEASNYSVRVTSQAGCIDSSAITVIFSYMACVGEEELETLPSTVIFPNPASHSLTVLRKEQSKPVGFRIFNVWGSKLTEGVLSERKETIIISMLPKGIYIFQVTNKNHTEHFCNLSKNKNNHL